MHVLMLLQAAQPGSEQAQLNQAKGYTLIAFIALVGLLGVILLLSFAAWRRAVRRSLARVREHMKESRPNAGAADPWATAGQRMGDRYSDDENNEQADDDEPSQR